MKKIVVLKGGVSREREISLRSGEAITQALTRKGYEVVSLDVKDFSFTSELLKLKPDAVFIALHGRFGEDGCMQGLLEWMKIPYTGPGVLCSSICFDKITTKKIVMPEGIISPRYSIYHGENPDLWIQNLSFDVPLILKPNTEGSSFGLFRVLEKKDLAQALKNSLQFERTILAEEMIVGRELTVGVHQGRALPIVEIVPQSGVYDFESKYTKGKTNYLVPAPLDEKKTKEIQGIAEKIYKILSCRGSVRMDFMLAQNGTPYFLEVNTIPGMTETSLLPKAAACTGIGFDDLCEQILNGALVR